MKFLSRLNDWVAKVETFFLCLSLMAMLSLAFLQVVMRNGFNSGIPWADSIVRLLVIWVGFLGACVATKLDQHLTLEVLTKYMPERLKYISAALVRVFAIGVCYFLFMASLKFIANERSAGEQFLHLMPSWYTIIIIPVAFLLIPFHLLFNIARDLKYFVKGRPAT